MVSLLTHIWVTRPQWIKLTPPNRETPPHLSLSAYPIQMICARFVSVAGQSPFSLADTLPYTVPSTNGWCFAHDDVIKWKHFPRYWPFVRGIHRSPVNSPHKGQWRGALMFTLICTRIKGWVNNREAGDLRRYRAHYDVIVMTPLR